MIRHAIVDIGSNSMRLTIYEVGPASFRILFKEKFMAGLASYVEGGALAPAGVLRAAEGLRSFGRLMDMLGVERQETSVFATASLRNVSNGAQAAEELRELSGLPVEIITGEEEARMAFDGAMTDLHIQQGVLTDVGGGSTEVTQFQGGAILSARSFPVGSLRLYRDCVKSILPGKGSLERIRQRLEEVLPREEAVPHGAAGDTLVCVGGSARALLKLSRQAFPLDPEGSAIPVKKLFALEEVLCRGEREAIDLILRTCPDRVHTIVPGVLILCRLARLCRCQGLAVSRYGVREGYLRQRVQSRL